MTTRYSGRGEFSPYAYLWMFVLFGGLALILAVSATVDAQTNQNTSKNIREYEVPVTQPESIVYDELDAIAATLEAVENLGLVAYFR